MEKNQILALIGGVLRALIAAVSGGAIANGVMKESDIEILVGAGVTIAVIAWSAIEKKKKAKELEG